MTRTPVVSCLRTLREMRGGLVDRVEGSVDLVLETLVSREVFTRDDREEVLCERGPRGRVRKVLDILDCKGEEAAGTFLLAVSHLSDVSTEVSVQSIVPTHNAEYSSVMKKHKAVLRRRSESILFYNTRHGEQVPFPQHYVNLLVVKGHHSLELKKHEVLTFGQRRVALQGKALEKRLIKPAQLFANTNNAGSRPPKRVLVTGVAGIGKTVLVQKILYDFGSDVEHVQFDFILQLTFRDLNLISKPVSFRDLVLRKNSHLSKCVDAILANESKLLIVLDGFDEFKHYKSTADVDVFVTEPGEEGEVTEVISSLIQGELLPEASVLLTSRPMAVSHVPVASVNCFAVITGFSSAEIRDFFERYFQQEPLAQQMFEKVAANEIMLTLCYIPAFCHIVCSILKDSDGLARESPKTMTDIYSQYLVALLQSHSHGRVDDASEQQRLREIVLKLAHLAYEKLMAHETLFYSSDMEAVQLPDSTMVSAFLDKTSVQEPGFTEDVFSFTHLTVQEFFAALHCAVAGEVASPDVENNSSSRRQEDEVTAGHLDLFDRFLSGLLSERNQRLLSRSVGLDASATRAEVYREGLLKSLQALCESGGPILTQLHCLFEQQDNSLLLDFHPSTLRVNVSDVSLSPMDYAVVKHFLRQTAGTISELDLTGSSITAAGLTVLQPHLNRCRSLWLGENTLDMEVIHVIAQVLQSSDTLTYLGLGWSDIGDEEVLVLADAIKCRQSLREICAIWNEVSEEEESLLNGASLDSQCVTVSFTDDLIWKAWCQWVLKRCQGNSTKKLMGILHKVCRSSERRQDVPWTRSFYGELLELIRSRIAECDEEDEDVRMRLEKFASIVAS
ncbi:NACHT, LRR and PYD domains-containing protein 3-like isoform X2 [Alosa pseudoharengus]|uniref:NACHT, LRR and PYD domains-containing protein 3-like isoform X2 n=1 Tax=Alosa pseudoharengus TaxID=34774 RepID=UPI003F88E2DF